MEREEEKRKKYGKRKEDTEMKQIIVLIAMVLLGIVLAGLVGQFGDSATAISENARTKIVETLGD